MGVISMPATPLLSPLRGSLLEHFHDEPRQNRATSLFFTKMELSEVNLKEKTCMLSRGSTSLTHPFFRPKRLHLYTFREFKRGRTLIFVFLRPSLGSSYCKPITRKYRTYHLQAAETWDPGRQKRRI